MNGSSTFHGDTLRKRRHEKSKLRSTGRWGISFDVLIGICVVLVLVVVVVDALVHTFAFFFIFPH